MPILNLGGVTLTPELLSSLLALLMVPGGGGEEGAALTLGDLSDVFSWRDGKLYIQVDNRTICLSDEDKLKVKTHGISTTELASNSVNERVIAVGVNAVSKAFISDQVDSWHAYDFFEQHNASTYCYRVSQAVDSVHGQPLGDFDNLDDLITAINTLGTTETIEVIIEEGTYTLDDATLNANNTIVFRAHGKVQLQIDASASGPALTIGAGCSLHFRDINILYDSKTFFQTSGDCDAFKFENCSIVSTADNGKFFKFGGNCTLFEVTNCDIEIYSEGDHPRFLSSINTSIRRVRVICFNTKVTATGSTNTYTLFSEYISHCEYNTYKYSCFSGCTVSGFRILLSTPTSSYKMPVFVHNNFVNVDTIDGAGSVSTYIPVFADNVITGAPSFTVYFCKAVVASGNSFRRNLAFSISSGCSSVISGNHFIISGASTSSFIRVVGYGIISGNSFVSSSSLTAMIQMVYVSSEAVLSSSGNRFKGSCDCVYSICRDSKAYMNDYGQDITGSWVKLTQYRSEVTDCSNVVLAGAVVNHSSNYASTHTVTLHGTYYGTGATSSIYIPQASGSPNWDLIIRGAHFFEIDLFNNGAENGEHLNVSDAVFTDCGFTALPDVDGSAFNVPLSVVNSDMLQSSAHCLETAIG